MTHPEESLKKLKVADLKGICKELKISNFSKLNKTSLIQLIVQRQTANTDESVTSALIVRELSHNTSESLKTNKIDNNGSAPKPSSQIKIQPPSDTTKRTPSHVPESSPPKLSKLSTVTPPETKRKADLCTEKKSITDTRSSSAHITDNFVLAKVKGISNRNHNAQLPKIVHTSDTCTRESLPPVKKARIKNGFQPLKPAIASPSTSSESKHTSVLSPINTTSTNDLIKSPHTRVEYMRKHFLEDIFLHLNCNRSTPTTSSSSATKTLQHPSKIPNLAFNGLVQDLYETITPTDAFIVALRFWISRLHTLMQMGSGESWSVHGGGLGLLGPDLCSWPSVIKCHQISQDFWMVETKSNAAVGESGNKYITIGLNGDVVCSDLDMRQGDTIEGCPLRTDWYSHIMANSKSEPKHSALLDRIRTKDITEHPHGISRAWQQKVQQQQSMSGLLQIAERAVLASCVLNSFSGSKMSAVDMDTQTLGHEPTKIDREFSRILSVHLDPHPKHAALASVHRQNGVAHFVLSETGQIVGDEDGGIADLWQGLLGCDSRGNVDRSKAKAFWKDWEVRMME
ncbi:uncharacterized protein L201_007767 [Kwoniella dendrophila CBS 6074]|uniref:Rho termination factor-like N-terminal domain-containing protein n=1 Tax=Kwoniella dendrophila CBS 6074 TaxID=1295534 RepID=A0AAX4K6T6_9TREE